MPAEAEAVRGLETSGQDRLDEAPVECRVAHGRDQPIALGRGVCGLESREVLDEADAGVGLHLAHRAVGLQLGQGQVGQWHRVSP